MSKTLIDRNEAFIRYYEMGSSRSIEKLHADLVENCPEIAPSESSLKGWCSNHNWVERALITDKAVADGLLETMVPSWVELKAELLSVLVEQVRKGRDKGIEPENIRDMTACTKEIRAMIGDDISKIDMKAEIEPPQQIEFVLYDADGVRRDMKTRQATDYQPEQ